MSKLLLAAIGMIIAFVAWALSLTNPAERVLFALGGLLLTLSIPMLLVVGTIKSLLLRSARFTAPRWQAYDTKTAVLELTSEKLNVSERILRHLFVFLLRAGVSAMVVGSVMLGAVYLMRAT